MSDPLVRDLLEQARHLARREPRRPKQASLRRAVSAAYYALFHLLAADVARTVCRSATFRPTVRRALEHRSVRRVCESVARRRSLPDPWNVHLDGIPEDLRRFAATLLDLQEQRHLADYDPTAAFARHEVLGLIEEARRSLDRWQALVTTHPRHVEAFLLALLLHGRPGRRSAP